MREVIIVYEIVVLLSIVSACIAFTVTKSVLFAPIRIVIEDHLPHKVSELFHCGYCFGHWVSFVLVAIYQPRLFNYFWPIDYFLTALVIAWLSGIQWAIFCILTNHVDLEE
jgi:hypothetical protein